MTQLTFWQHRHNQRNLDNAGYLFYETSEAFHFRSLGLNDGVRWSIK